MFQAKPLRLQLLFLSLSQTAELVNVALDIFLGRNFSAPGMYFITIFCNLICPQISHFHCI
jgi:hypothetical protein